MDAGSACRWTRTPRSFPTFGSKEAVFLLAQVLAGDLVIVPQPSYPVYERGAVFAGKEVVELPLRAADGFLPDLEAVGADVWSRTAILWLNYPNNPTAATATLELYERAAALAREHDFVLASDEAYSELYFGSEPPVSALQVADRTNVAVFNTLSKRSSMPGYRSGFVAGDPELVAALKRYRPNVGVAPPEFVQLAAAAAWGDEAHVAAVRDLYRAKRDVLLPALEARGLRHVGGDATFFLWLEGAPAGFQERLLERGVILTPGDYFGAAGAGLPAARARPHPGASAGRPPTYWLACSAAFRPCQLPTRALHDLDRPALRVAPEQQPLKRRSARAP